MIEAHPTAHKVDKKERLSFRTWDQDRRGLQFQSEEAASARVSRLASSMWCSRKVPVETPELNQLARSLLIQEHASLRAEVLASYGYAQSIVKWTLATFAAVVAAGLVALFNATNGEFNYLLINLILIIFGFGIPGIVWLSSWTWLGELYRAERAGSYLRAMEEDLAQIPGLQDQFGFQPMRWESFIWSNRKTKGLWGKQTMTYLGTAGVLFGAAIGSSIILLVLVLELAGAGAFPPDSSAVWFWPLGSLAFNLVLLAGCGWIYQRLALLGREKATVPRHF